jgi:predicted alpha/beta hydrolase
VQACVGGMHLGLTQVPYYHLALDNHTKINYNLTRLPIHELFFLLSAYKLIEEGYDCWLANLRGSPLSKGHVNLSTDSKSYWDFTFHEMGLYDLTKTVSYILETTGNSSMSYIGHSMG